MDAPVKALPGGKSSPQRARIPYSWCPLPSVYVTDWLPLLSGNEVKVLLALTHKTWSFGKDHDVIPHSQIATLTGLSLSNLRRALTSLLDKNLITASGPPNRTRSYSLQTNRPGPCWKP